MDRLHDPALILENTDRSWSRSNLVACNLSLGILDIGYQRRKGSHNKIVYKRSEGTVGFDSQLQQ